MNGRNAPKVDSLRELFVFVSKILMDENLRNVFVLAELFSIGIW